MSNTRRKVDLYLLSLGLLFIFFIIINVDIPLCFGESCSFIGWKNLLTSNSISIVSLTLLGYCVFAYKRFDFDLKGATELPFEIKKIESVNFEHLTFLATYVVPLISFDFGSNRQMIVLVLLLIVMGVIYLKTDLFYANPSLALLGFQIYKADGSFKNGNREGLILIARERLNQNQKVSYIRLDDRIYYVRRIV